MIRGEFACVKSDEEIMIITGSSMMEWTGKIIAQRRQAVIEEDVRQRALHFDEYAHSLNNLSLQGQMSVGHYQQSSIDKFGTTENRAIRI